jgi:beta-lactamase class A
MTKKMIGIHVALSLLVLATIGYLVFRAQDRDFLRCSERYTFLSSELDCGTINEKIEQVDRVSESVGKYTNQEENAGRARQVSVFFRDLDSRQWFGINENAKFYPASLAKLPIAMMYYKTAEINPKILSSELQVSEADVKLNEVQHYRSEKMIEPGKPYMVRELLHDMLTYSDNAPVRILTETAQNYSEQIFSDLGIYESPKEEGDTGTWNVTAKSYANLFRVLYNASYVRPEYSNEILEELGDSRFHAGIEAGVPSGVRVAHKFGEAERVNRETNEMRIILNDCGIVYKKESPYIICIMTEGGSYEKQENIIKTISAMVYDSF